MSSINTQDTTADKKVRACIQAKKSFVMESGAGSGKLTALIKGIKTVLDIHGEKLQQSHQKIACIANKVDDANRINKELSHNQLVYVSTIYDFFWPLIEPFQDDIRAWVLTQKGTSESREVIEKQDFMYGPVAYYERGVISISDIKSIVLSFKDKELFRKIVAQKFPFIFVVKVQDIDEGTVDFLKKIKMEQQENFFLGFFFDPLQQSILNGIKKIEINAEEKQNWEIISENNNFRCSHNIVKLVNKIRKMADLPEQTPKPAQQGENSQPYEGEVHLFILPDEQAKRAENIEQVRRYLAKLHNEDGWMNSDKDSGRLKILQVELFQILNSLGCTNISKFIQDPMSIALLGNLLYEDSIVMKLLDFLWPLALNNAEGRKDEVMDLLRKYIPSLNPKNLEKNPDIVATLDALNTNVNMLTDMMMGNTKHTIGDLFKFIYDKNLAPLDRSMLYDLLIRHIISSKYMYSTCHEIEWPIDIEVERMVNSFFKFSARQLRPSYNYIENIVPLTAEHMSIFFKFPARQLRTSYNYIENINPLTAEHMSIFFKFSARKLRPFYKYILEDYPFSQLMSKHRSIFFKSPAKELLTYYNYKTNNTQFFVQYLSGGKEFDRVLVVADPTINKPIDFMYEIIFGLSFIEDDIKEYYEENKQKIIDITLSLFYVSCTRAKKDLAVVLFTSDQDAKAKIVARNLFERKNIHTEDDLKKALEKQDGPAV